MLLLFKATQAYNFYKSGVILQNKRTLYYNDKLIREKEWKETVKRDFQ